MNITAIIPAKQFSKRVSGKNLLKLDNQSLVYWACKRCLDCPSITNVYIDTESSKIMSSVSPLLERGLRVIKRPIELANNKTSGNDLIKFELSHIDTCDLILHTYATSPLISWETTEQCIQTFLSQEKHDSFFSAVRYQEYLWTLKGKEYIPVNFNYKTLPNSQDLKGFWEETHGLYGIKYDVAKKLNSRLGENPMPIEISAKESLDINQKEDYITAKALWKI